MEFGCDAKHVDTWEGIYLSQELKPYALVTVMPDEFVKHRLHVVPCTAGEDRPERLRPVSVGQRTLRARLIVHLGKSSGVQDTHQLGRCHSCLVEVVYTSRIVCRGPPRRSTLRGQSKHESIAKSWLAT